MSVLLPGFAAAADAQSCFRAVLEAMSRPGKVTAVAAALTPPAGLCVAAAATLLTLADNTTSVSLPAGMAPAQDWLVFHTGARLAPATEADFVLASHRPRLAASPRSSPAGLPAAMTWTAITCCPASSTCTPIIWSVR